MNISDVKLSNYSASNIAIKIESAKSGVETGNTAYDGSKIDNLSLQSGKLVSFVNKDGDNVRVYLNNMTLDRLQTKFGDKEFEAQDANTIKISGKAGEYLSGFWETAKSNILSADKNANGVVEGKELLNLAISPSVGGYIDLRRNSFSVNIESSFAKINDGYIPKDKKELIASQLGSMSVDEAFNYLLAYDKDANRDILAGELTSEKQLLGIYKHVSDNDSIVLMEEYKIGDRTIRYEEYGLSKKATEQIGIESKAKNSLKLLEQDKSESAMDENTQKAIQKFKASNGDENALSATEKEALGARLATIKKGLEAQESLPIDKAGANS